MPLGTGAPPCLAIIIIVSSSFTVSLTWSTSFAQGFPLWTDDAINYSLDCMYRTVQRAIPVHALSTEKRLTSLGIVNNFVLLMTEGGSMKSLTQIILTGDSIDVIFWDILIKFSLFRGKVCAVEDRANLVVDMSVSAIGTKVTTFLALEKATLPISSAPHLFHFGEPVITGEYRKIDSTNLILSSLGRRLSCSGNCSYRHRTRFPSFRFRSRCQFLLVRRPCG